MALLAIDTSFDDTAAAVTNGYIVLSSVFSSDLALHEEWGGVVPNLAREYHKKNIDRIIALAMKRAHLTWNEIDAIAVTRGPGLAVSLEVGLAKATELSNLHKKPLIAVNHMEGHLLSFLCQVKKRKNNKYSIPNSQQHTTVPFLKPEALSLDPFPLLSILISGGHTQFVYAREIGAYEIIGETQDDAIGECFDKVGRMLGLGFPGGKFVEQIAKEGTLGGIQFPVPMRHVKSADTSYSGLKTAAMKIVNVQKEANEGTLSRQQIADIACAFQDAALKHLIEKLEFAIQFVKKNNEANKLQSLAVGGGVAANLQIRKRLRHVGKKHGVRVYFPYNKKLCTDNAAMIGIAAAHKFRNNDFADSTQIDRLPNFPLGKLL